MSQLATHGKNRRNASRQSRLLTYSRGVLLFEYVSLPLNPINRCRDQRGPLDEIIHLLAIAARDRAGWPHTQLCGRKRYTLHHKVTKCGQRAVWRAPRVFFGITVAVFFGDHVRS